MNVDAVDVVARQLVALAELDDHDVTEAVGRAARDAGADLVGLDHRVKSVDSLRRKLGDLLAQDPTLTINETAEQVYDVLRFTVVAESDGYMEVHGRVLATLGAEGVDLVEEDNHWPGSRYRGINARLRMRGSRRFEIQFHTRESYAAAKATRGLYEEFRPGHHTSTSPSRTGSRDRRRLRSDPGTTRGSIMTYMSTEFYASTIGGNEPRLLARFITDERGLQVERFDRQEGRWVQDSSVAGFFIGHDDFAKPVTRAQAQDIIRAWGKDPDLVDALVVEPAST